MIVNNKIKKIFSNTLVKDTGAYTFLYILDKTIPFVILPIITRFITKEEMGTWILFQSIFSIMIPLLSLCFSNTITIKYFKQTREEFIVYLNQIFLYAFILFGVSLLLVLSFHSYIERIIDFSEKWQYIFCLLVLFDQFILIRMALWRMDRKLKLFSLFTISYTLLQNSLSLLAVSIYGLGWEGLVYSKVMSYGVFFFISLMSFNKDRLIKLELKIRKELLPDILKISIPIAIHRFGTWLGDSASRLIINFLIGAAATGSYGIAAVFSVVITVILDSFNKAYVPYLYDKLAKINSDIKIHLVKLTYICYILIFILAIFVGLFGYFGVEFIYGKQYADTKPIIILLSCSAAINGLYKLHVNYIFFTEKTHLIMRVTFLSGTFNCLFSFFMVKYYGMIGAAFSQLITGILVYLLVFYTANKLYPLPWFDAFKNGKRV